MSENFYWISKKGLANLEKQYQEILNEERETQKKIGESVKMDNDLRENPDYMQLQTKAVSELKYKKNKVKEVMNNHKIIEDAPSYKNFIDDYVSVGSKVKVQFEDNEVDVFTILGYGESNLEKNIISYLSPLGQALLDQKTGQELAFSPQGIDQKILILSIEKGEWS